MKRLHQALLIGTFVPLCWLAMQAAHELGHVLGRIITAIIAIGDLWEFSAEPSPHMPHAPRSLFV